MISFTYMYDPNFVCNFHYSCFVHVYRCSVHVVHLDTFLLILLMQLSHHLYMIILYDMLLGKGIQCGGQIKRFLLDHKTELLAAFHKIEGNTGFLKSSRTHIHQCKEGRYRHNDRVLY